MVDEFPSLISREGRSLVRALPGALHRAICAPAAPRVTTVCARENRENDVGCRCAPPALPTCAPAKRRTRLHTKVLSVALRAAGAAGVIRAGLGATRQSEGLLRVRGRARLRTPGPAPSGRSRTSDPLREGRPASFRDLPAPEHRTPRLWARRRGSERNVTAHLEEHDVCIVGPVSDVEDDARPVAPSEGEARTGSR